MQNSNSSPIFTVLYRFKGGADGSQTFAGLAMGPNGSLFGTTGGGDASPCAGGCGTVFELTPPASPGGPWTESVLHGFTGTPDAANPMAGVTIGEGGTIYGTTFFGGDWNEGAVYELTRQTSGGPAWTETVIYSFGAQEGDGINPLARLVLGPDGSLYGTTYFGGTWHYGTVFRLIPPASTGLGWTENVLYSFQGGADAAYPYAGVVRGRDGVLYGTTGDGGGASWGTVFSLTPSSAPDGPWLETVLYSFTHENGDGAEPEANVVIGASGELYGTTVLGGAPIGGGTVFELYPPASPGGAWIETVLYAFSPPDTDYDGFKPLASLAIGAEGSLYGTTVEGSSDMIDGTVFKLSPPAPPGGFWTERLLHIFEVGSGAGIIPVAGLVLGRNGVLYGTTEQGGARAKSCPEDGCGTVFELVP